MHFVVYLRRYEFLGNDGVAEFPPLGGRELQRAKYSGQGESEDKPKSRQQVFRRNGRRNSRDGISGLCAYLLFGRRFQGKASQSDRPRSRRRIFLVDSLFDFADRSCVGRPR